ncbi:hypothetical protein SADUNF_Sadunf18G0107100 [Salix dunnii]|uniref:Uncharacterized protein n=1 Tax=Salix dunnii TaxID=1413687 RepID=A0A835MJ90_9ROSI|nr:hypothetical protein SADUNF_Sadunf18G0107100 [Salix dunnii]
MCFVFLCDEEERELGRLQASGSCPHCGGKEAGVVYILETEKLMSDYKPKKTQQLASHLPWRSMNIPIKMAASPIFDFLREEDEISEMGSSSLL